MPLSKLLSRFRGRDHHLPLAALGEGVEDPGTDWHPRHKDGDLPCLGEGEMSVHLSKPERADQVDAGSPQSCGGEL